MEKLNYKTIKTRAKAPISPFFKKIRNIGLILTAIGGTVAMAPIALPAAIVTIGGYAAFGGALIASVSQMTVDPDKIKYYKPK